MKFNSKAKMNTIVILGAGQIGSAAYKILQSRISNADYYDVFLGAELHLWNQIPARGVTGVYDFSTSSTLGIQKRLQSIGATHVINALPFMLNEKIALASAGAGCHYIDFTEDDIMADKVKQIYSVLPSLTVAVKCGLAPGFINYVGHALAKKIDKPETLLISVGALPRHVNFSSDPAANYNLSWSVDGLVNEYIRPCRVRINGQAISVRPLTGSEHIIVDGINYEAAFTSGGVGSLVQELKHVPNVYYKTLRYPGHYDYVRGAITRHAGNFDRLRAEFINTFSINTNDVIVVYASCTGHMLDGTLRREVFAEHYVGADGLSGIQSVTAGAGIAILELMLSNKISGTINHADVSLESFINTESYKSTYFRR